jgi:signal transduction histidine kinase
MERSIVQFGFGPQSVKMFPSFPLPNGGEPIPAEYIDRLFEPFSRASFEKAQEGLGLGLYIASEIARAHRGSRAGASTAETCFTFRMLLSHDT